MFGSLLLLLTLVLNSWTWQLVKQNLFLAFILLTITISLFALTFAAEKSLRKIAFLVLLLTFCVGSFYFLQGNFDRSLREKNPTEVSIALKRHGYFAEGLGKLFTNKFSLQFFSNWYYPITNYSRNISYSIDPNLYFFMSHPREKSGIDEFGKYSPLLLPVFLLGLFTHFLSLSKYKTLTAYLITAIIITGFATPYYKLGPVFLFPYLNLIIVLGGINFLNFVRKKYET
ncbi:MAG: hypothetical protein PHE48_02985 [Candidatus Daviesbacteria bacterium]|nr:hypothetical protein [Candidatus Daviesbacteria bacterium]